jgi:DNA replication protein DnaC
MLFLVIPRSLLRGGFIHDSTLTSAVLDRLLHHADTIIIEGKSFRMKDQLES